MTSLQEEVGFRVYRARSRSRLVRQRRFRMVQFGTGVGSAASGGSGFFFFAIAALVALAGLYQPRVICALRLFGAPHVPQPFLPLLERPG